MRALVDTRNRKPERIFIVGVDLKSSNPSMVRDSLEELAELSQTAGGEVVGQGAQKLEAPVAATFIGSGKAIEFAHHCRENGVDTVIFDDELSPAQTRNLEKLFDCKVLDRTALILDIFAQRARTREGKLQVELAQLQHLLPRLTRFWTHLSRQKGGIGMRGDGETQLETDRRRVQERIAHIRDELEVVRRQRGTQRAGRLRQRWPLASIVGYTNAGKSTLLNALTGADVVAVDKLFATLDPTTRRLALPGNQSVLLSDTVGFIRKLPHDLVEAFKATLEEVVQADLLLHVVDASQVAAEEQIAAVNAVLAELGAQEKPTLMVLNKVDVAEAQEQAGRLQAGFPNSVKISARTGEGFAELMESVRELLRPIRDFVDLEIPFEEAAVIARLHQVGQVVEKDYSGDKARFRARVPPHLTAEFSAFTRKN